MSTQRPANHPRTIHDARAVIWGDGRLLVVANRPGDAAVWQLPGGAVPDRVDPREHLANWCDRELGIGIEPLAFAPPTRSFRPGENTVWLPVLARIVRGVPACIGVARLAWLTPRELTHEIPSEQADLLHAWLASLDRR